jgi:thiamine-phosphate pyrophosphorylase
MTIAFPRLYAIIDRALLQEPAISFTEKLIRAGVRLFQVRDKRGSARQLLVESRELVSQMIRFSARLIVNDRPDVCALAGAGGVHVGQSDLAVADARQLCPYPCWVGISTHNLAEVEQAAKQDVDYIAVGPVFATATKENAAPVVGLELIEQARKATSKPIVAIGGVRLERAADVIRAGADAVAVAGDLLCSADPEGRAREYLHLLS